MFFFFFSPPHWTINFVRGEISLNFLTTDSPVAAGIVNISWQTKWMTEWIKILSKGNWVNKHKEVDWWSTRRWEITRSRGWKRNFTNLISPKLGLLLILCIADWDCLDLLRWMVVCIFRFWKPETVCSPDGKADGSIWEQTYCEDPLFTTLHTLVAGQMSPINNCHYISISFCLTLLRKLQWAAIWLPIFPEGWIFPPLLASWLLWLSITVHFSCPHHQWEPRCSAWRCGQVFKYYLGSRTQCFACWRGRLDENKFHTIRNDLLI